MGDMPDISKIAALMGDPARARMLTALTSGTALTATELSLEGGILPSTASSHLSKLHDAGLLSMERQGRHRYFCLAGPDVADLLERLMGIAAGRQPRMQAGPRDLALRTARVCYDHLAGSLAVRLFASLEAGGAIVARPGNGDDPNQILTLSNSGYRFFARIGIDVTALPRTRRPLCRSCLDWSERRPHLAGTLGAEVLRYVYKHRWARRDPAGRAVLFSSRGLRLFEAICASSAR